jgi:hypothetical protein
MEAPSSYVLARRTLLDALQALDIQRAAVILCGAQAIYLQVGDSDFAVAPYTTICPDNVLITLQLTLGIHPIRVRVLWPRRGLVATTVFPLSSNSTRGAATLCIR